MMFDRTSIPLAINAPIPIFVTADVSLKFLGIESPPRRASTMPEQKWVLNNLIYDLLMILSY